MTFFVVEQLKYHPVQQNVDDDDDEDSFGIVHSLCVRRQY